MPLQPSGSFSRPKFDLRTTQDIELQTRRAMRLDSAKDRLQVDKTRLDELPGASLYVPTPSELVRSIDYFSKVLALPADSTLQLSCAERTSARTASMGSYEYATCVASLWRVHELLLKKLRESPTRIPTELETLEEKRTELAGSGYGYYGPPYYRTVGYDEMVRAGVEVFGKGERSLIDFTKKLLHGLPSVKRIADNKGDKRQGGDKATGSNAQRIAAERTIRTNNFCSPWTHWSRLSPRTQRRRSGRQAWSGF